MLTLFLIRFSEYYGAYWLNLTYISQVTNWKFQFGYLWHWFLKTVAILSSQWMQVWTFVILAIQRSSWKHLEMWLSTHKRWDILCKLWDFLIRIKVADELLARRPFPSSDTFLNALDSVIESLSEYEKVNKHKLSLNEYN